MLKYIYMNIRKMFAVVCGTLIVLCTLLSLGLIGLDSKYVTADAATAPQASWMKQKVVNVTYLGSEYRVTLFKDIAFNPKQVLFTSTPVYHDGNELDYTVTITQSASTEISESVGVSVTSEVKAFGNGIKTSLGITTTIAQSYTTSTSDSHHMQLDESDVDGFWAVYGYNLYSRYKIEVEKKCSRQVLVRSTPVYGWVKEGKNDVYKIVKYNNVYKTEYYYDSEPKYSGEFLTAAQKPNKFIFDYMYLGSGK